MKYILFLSSLLVASASFAQLKPLVKNHRLTYNGPGHYYHIRNDDKKFYFNTPSKSWEFEINKCNSFLVDEFWRDLNRPIMSQGMLASKKASFLKYAKITYQNTKRMTQNYSPLAQKLSKVPFQAKILKLVSKKHCNEKRKPANTFEEALEEAMRKAGRKVKTLATMEYTCPWCAEDEHKPQAINCVRQICPSRNQEDHLEVVMAALEENIWDKPSQFNVRLKARIQELVQESINELRVSLNELKDAIQKPLEVDSYSRVIHNATFIRHAIDGVVPAPQLDESGNIISVEVNEEASRNNLPHFTESDLQIALNIARHYFNRSDIQESLQAFNGPADIYYQNLAGENGLPETIRARASQVEDRVRSLRANESLAPYTRLRGILDDYIDTELVERAQTGRLTNQDMNVLRNQDIGSQHLEVMLTDPRIQELVADRNIESIQTERGIGHFNLEYLDTALNSLEDRERLNVIYNRTSQACEAVYRVNEQVLPTGAQIDGLRRDEPAIIRNVLSSVGSYFSETTMKKLRDLSSDWKFAYPPTANEFRASIESRILASIRSTTDGSFHREDVTSGDFDSVVAGFAYTSDPRSVEGLIGRAIKVCSAFRSPPYTDAAFDGAGGIQTGWMSTRFPQIGRQVMAHEVAHLVSLSLKRGEITSEPSKVKYNETRQCLSDMHPSAPKMESYLRNAFGDHPEAEALSKGGFYNEEDFADMVMGMTTSVMVKNAWCTMPTEILSLTNWENYGHERLDTHSSVFYRLLHTEAVKRGGQERLPEECQAFIGQFEGAGPFGKCLK